MVHLLAPSNGGRAISRLHSCYFRSPTAIARFQSRCVSSQGLLRVVIPILFFRLRIRRLTARLRSLVFLSVSLRPILTCPGWASTVARGCRACCGSSAPSLLRPNGSSTPCRAIIRRGLVSWRILFRVLPIRMPLASVSCVYELCPFPCRATLIFHFLLISYL